MHIYAKYIYGTFPSYLHVIHVLENRLNNKVFTLTYRLLSHASSLMIHCKLISCYANSLFKLLGYSMPHCALPALP